MFGLGFQELIVVGVVAVLLFGKRLPEVARSLGGSYQQFRRGLTDIQRQLDVSQYIHSDLPAGPSHEQDAEESGAVVAEQPTAPKFAPPAPCPSSTNQDV